MKFETFKDLPAVLFNTQEEWRVWLSANHEQQQGLWLKHAKKASGKQSVSYQEALEEALCYGWIDGQKQAFDGDYYLQKFTPRRPRSIWSKVNVDKVEALIKAGKMQRAGLAAMESAKKDGRWDAAYDSASTMQTPKDFLAELDKNPKAKEFFASLNKTNVYAICWRIHTAKKPETRKARIQKFVDMLNRSEKLY